MSIKLLSAHAGGPEGYFLPNTRQAIDAIKDSGVDLIEFDVRVTKDNYFILFHDDKILIRNKLYKIHQLTYKEIRQYAKNVCLLKDVLLLIRDHAMAHVDIKTPHKVLEIVDLCTATIGNKSFVITTPDTKVVKIIRSNRPKVFVDLTIGSDTSGMSFINKFITRIGDYFPFIRIAKSHPTGLAINYREAMPWTVRFASIMKLPILLWTIDDEMIIRKTWANKQVWAFTTNFPRKALTLRSHD